VGDRRLPGGFPALPKRSLQTWTAAPNGEKDLREEDQLNLYRDFGRKPIYYDYSEVLSALERMQVLAC
jgi:hypothetical protein